MAEFTWTYDVTDNVHKNNALSKKLRYAAIAACVFAPHARPEEGFGKRKGESVTITRIRNTAEPTNPRLSETDRIPEDALSISTVKITVTEFGRSIPFTHKSDLLSTFDIENPIQKQLRNQMKLSLDTATATAFKTAKIKYIPTSLTGGVFDTDGTASTTALANLTFAHCGIIRDYMQDTIHCPFYSEDGEYYVGIGSTKALRGIKSDPEFQDLSKYLKLGDLVYKSEVGKAEQIRWTECNKTNSLSNAKGSGSVLGEALVFGDDAVAMAEAETPELRAAMPDDFGRKRAVAWYGVLEFGIIWDTANDGEARIIHITSA